MKIRSLCVCLIATFAAATAHAQPANDACAASAAISGYGTFPWSNVLATTDGTSNPGCLFFGQPQISSDLWYCWTAPETANVAFSTCAQTSLDTKLAVYGGCACPEGTGLIVCNDDASGCGVQTTVRFNAVTGSTYLLRVGSFATTAAGSGTFSLAEFVPATLAGPIVNPANMHTYFLLPSSSWTLAESDAVVLGGHLVTTNDAAENEWVRASVLMFDGTSRRGWIGLNDIQTEGTYVWVSGEASTFLNWAPGEPNNSGPGGITEDYVEMFGTGLGLWNDQQNLPPTLQIFGVVEIGDDTPACPADFNGVGGLTIQDIFDFLSAYFSNNPTADFNNAGGVTVQDIFDFLNAYFTGC